MTALAELKRLIDAANVSHLSRVSEVSRSQLTRIVDGKTSDPGIETVEQILNALGYDLQVVPRQKYVPTLDQKPRRKELED